MQAKETISADDANTIFRSHYRHQSASKTKIYVPFWWLKETTTKRVVMKKNIVHGKEYYYNAPETIILKNIFIPANKETSKLNVTPHFNDLAKTNQQCKNVEPITMCLKYVKDNDIDIEPARLLLIPYYQFTFTDKTKTYNFFVNASTGGIDDELKKAKDTFIIGTVIAIGSIILGGIVLANVMST
jgi:hypothetical protein